MAEPKTRPTKASVAAFIGKVTGEERREDCRTLVRIMKKISKSDPVMWGPAIIGFGTQQLRYANGSELDWPLLAFSPRKRDLTLYIMSGFGDRDGLLAKLGRHRTGKACLYLKRLSDVDMKVLEQLIASSMKQARSKPARA